MIELRWLKRKTGKSLMNEHGYFYDETVKILQYRQKYDHTDYGVITNAGDFSVIRMWSDWIDVPIVEE
jgi:hypothetical protein